MIHDHAGLKPLSGSSRGKSLKRNPQHKSWSLIQPWRFRLPFCSAHGTIGLYARWRTEIPGREGNNKTLCSGSLLDRDSILYPRERGKLMNSIVYIVGLIVIVVAILSFFGLR